MKCSLCGSSGHNKRTCSHRGKDVNDIPSPIEIRIAESLSSSLDDKISLRKCSLCGSSGHNKRTCSIKESQACLDIKSIFDKTMEKLKPPKRVITCSLCKGKDHNSRTCFMKCKPCSDQVARSYCFSGMSATQAVSVARILECDSIYGETEEYPQFVDYSTQRKTEDINFANGETISIDLGVIS